MSDRKAASDDGAREPRRRRSLSHLGGPTELVGDATAAKGLAHALDVAPAEEPTAQRNLDAAPDDPDRAHVHGFHSYPARMHPVTAARLVEAFSPAGGLVLDPFCGSGTVLVEALVGRRRTHGTDLNPLAVALSKCKTRQRTPIDIERLVAVAGEIAASADERRRARAGSTRRYGPDDVALFEPHVLLELDGLRAAITASKEPVAADLSLVLSAILVKVSRKQGDTSDRTAPRRLAAGYTAKLFRRKAEELARRLGEFARLVPAGMQRARVKLDDATKLASVEAGTVDAVVTSPPYAATYDYLAQHALRLRWLGFDTRDLERGELGARRRYAELSATEARAAFRSEVRQFLEAICRVTRKGANVVLLMADSAIAGEALRAHRIVDEAAHGLPLIPLARVAQPRPHFHAPTRAAFRDEPRAEHGMLLVRR